jgi:hypothetical protein
LAVPLICVLISYWLEEEGDDIHFEILPPDAVNNIINRFYATLIPANSGDAATANIYSKSSYINIRTAIKRHIRSPPFNRILNIMKDKEFTSSNMHSKK